MSHSSLDAEATMAQSATHRLQHPAPVNLSDEEYEAVRSVVHGNVAGG